MAAKFELGRTVITPNALRTLSQESVQGAIARHLEGDWGELCNEDREANDQALKEGWRLLSAYSDRNGTKFWIITEGVPPVTTVLLPEDY